MAAEDRDLVKRVADLEVALSEQASLADFMREELATEARLAEQIESLAGRSGTLVEALAVVARNQERIEEQDRKIAEKASTEEVEAKEADLAAQGRKRFLFALVFAFAAMYFGIGIHEVYRDKCDSTLTFPPSWCDYVFPFDAPNGEGNPLQQRVRHNTTSGHSNCVATNRDIDTDVAIWQDLLKVSTAPPNPTPQQIATRERFVRYLEAKEANKEDCDVKYPLPE